MRDSVEWAALGATAVLLAIAGAAFARDRARKMAPVVVDVPAPMPPPNPEPWFRSDAQPHALSVVDGFVAWAEGDGNVRVVAASGDPRSATTFTRAFPLVGPVLSPGSHQACWFTSDATLQCGATASESGPPRAIDIAHAPGSVVHMDVDAAGVVWTQFDGQVIEVPRDAKGDPGAARTLASLRNAVDVRLDGDDAYVVTLDPLRVVRLSRARKSAPKVVFERVGPTIHGESSIGHLGSLLVDRTALYLDTQDSRDGLDSVLSIAKSDGAVTTLYRGFAHVALATLQHETLFGVSAPVREDQLDLEHATLVALPTRGGPLRRPDRLAQNLEVGWGASIAADPEHVYFTRGPRNPIGAPGTISRLVSQ